MARFGRSDTGEQPESTPAPAPEPTIAERLEGLRAWVAQLDRRIGVRTYAGAAALVLALAAAAIALVLVLQLQDETATDSDVQELRDEIAGVEDTASEAAQEDVQSLSDRLTEIESQISEIASDQDSVDQEISVIQDDIQDLRDQLAEADSGGAGSSSGGTSANSP
jgi:septal ring factor EnvC (AmiA/AmiB activator)